MPDQLGLANEWYARLSEPVRPRPRSPAALDLSFRSNAAWYNLSSQKLTGWYRPLTEPVRNKPPLPRGASPYLIIGLKTPPEYRFAITETGDTASLTFVKYLHKNRARVSIVEVQTYLAQVSVKVIR